MLHDALLSVALVFVWFIFQIPTLNGVRQLPRMLDFEYATYTTLKSLTLNKVLLRVAI
jgi:hypothetical protein